MHAGWLVLAAIYRFIPFAYVLNTKKHRRHYYKGISRYFGDKRTLILEWHFFYPSVAMVYQLLLFRIESSVFCLFQFNVFAIQYLDIYNDSIDSHTLICTTHGRKVSFFIKVRDDDNQFICQYIIIIIIVIDS